MSRAGEGGWSGRCSGWWSAGVMERQITVRPRVNDNGAAAMVRNPPVLDLPWLCSTKLAPRRPDCDLDVSNLLGRRVAGVFGTLREVVMTRLSQRE